MHIERLSMSGFRNFDSETVELSPGANLLFGPNGSGKSNLLEGIFYLCTAKSFRGATDDVLLRDKSEFFRLVGEGSLNDSPLKIEIAYKPREKKRIKINDVPETKLSTLYEYLKVVSFGPDDVELVYGPPTVRRRFLDISIAQLDRGYISLLWEYRKVLAQRNALLRELGEAYDSLGAVDGDELLGVWDERLIEFGLAIHRARARFIQRVSELAGDFHSKLVNTDSRFDIKYTASPRLEEQTEAAFKEKLASRRRRELVMKQSMYGPHRDDLQFLLSDVDCRSFASRGQVKTAVLAIKLAVFEHIKALCGEAPILLLDEIYSDLDRNRLDSLSLLLPGLSQVLVTTSKLEEVRDLDAFENSLSIIEGRVNKHKS
ncbi:MAG: DNA replication/repair protein RecF [Candidatus Zixiibacteriota bacterium]